MTNLILFALFVGFVILLIKRGHEQPYKNGEGGFSGGDFGDDGGHGGHGGDCGGGDGGGCGH